MKKIIIAAYLLIFNIHSSWAQDDYVNIYAAPRTAPSHAIRNDYGKEMRLQDFKGKFLLAFFWSRSCSVCLRNMKRLASLQEDVKNDGIQIIIISPERDWNSVDERQNFIRRIGGETLPSYVDVKGNLSESFGIFSHPNTVLINSKSYEIGRIRGGVHWDNDNFLEYLYKIKAENNQAEPLRPDISIKKIKVEEL
ncbi:MAG: TlpA family protein disulfide reductase [Lactobacillus sp.]|jgi:peroxiredoxin|nr:TlpA family protein disulfide reductase [Lactobacillus sp.]